MTGQIEAIVASQGGHRDERSLLDPVVRRSTPVAAGTNETHRVELGNGMVGYHKSFSGLHDQNQAGFGQDSAQQPVHEVAAWQLAKELGGEWEQIVPPVVVREVNGQLGSFALERPGRTGNRSGFVESPEWHSAAFFDAVIGQQDRHWGNYLVAGDRLALIDHGFAFAKPGNYRNYSMLLDRRIDDGDAKLNGHEKAALEKLLASPDTLGLGKILQPDRVAALRARAERMRKAGTLLTDY